MGDTAPEQWMSSGNIKIAPSIEKHAQARATLQKLLSGLRVKYGRRLPGSNTMTPSSAGEAREHRKAAQRQTKEDIYTSQKEIMLGCSAACNVVCSNGLLSTEHIFTHGMACDTAEKRRPP
ncbi:hypothetical protein LA080_001495 [Diaporthe eres]|nr:hypothetical protein LA080_001495 [Diaporthe eres]